MSIRFIIFCGVISKVFCPVVFASDDPAPGELVSMNSTECMTLSQKGDHLEVSSSSEDNPTSTYTFHSEQTPLHGLSELSNARLEIELPKGFRTLRIQSNETQEMSLKVSTGSTTRMQIEKFNVAGEYERVIHYKVEFSCAGDVPAPLSATEGTLTIPKQWLSLVKVTSAEANIILDGTLIEKDKGSNSYFFPAKSARPTQWSLHARAFGTIAILKKNFETSPTISTEHGQVSLLETQAPGASITSDSGAIHINSFKILETPQTSGDDSSVSLPSFQIRNRAGSIVVLNSLLPENSSISSEDKNGVVRLVSTEIKNTEDKALSLTQSGGGRVELFRLKGHIKALLSNGATLTAENQESGSLVVLADSGAVTVNQPESKVQKIRVATHPSTQWSLWSIRPGISTFQDIRPNTEVKVAYGPGSFARTGFSPVKFQKNFSTSFHLEGKFMADGELRPFGENPWGRTLTRTGSWIKTGLAVTGAASLGIVTTAVAQPELALKASKMIGSICDFIAAAVTKNKE